MLCDDHSKQLYTSTKTARSALTGQLRSKRIRVYECDAHPGKFHVTKETVNKIDHGNRKQHGDRVRRPRST